jgi:hypothetical protein
MRSVSHALGSVRKILKHYYAVGHYAVRAKILISLSQVHACLACHVS